MKNTCRCVLLALVALSAIFLPSRSVASPFEGKIISVADANRDSDTSKFVETPRYAKTSTYDDDYIYAADSISSFAGIGNDTVYSSQTICYNTTPVALTGTTPTGGIGVYTYKWQTSTVSGTTGYAIIAGATSTGYAPGVLTATHWYRRIVTSGLATDTTAPVQITVTPVIVHANNIISAAQAICINTAPAAITGSTPTGGDGVNYTYTWQSSPDNTTFTLISGATAIGYSPPVLTATTYYRRIVSSGNCSDISTSIKMTVTPVITNNTIKVDQSVCSGQTPLTLTGTTPTGGNGTFSSLWLSSTTSAVAGFAAAAGTNNGYPYTAPAGLSQTTWYRRVINSGGCSDTTAATTITVVSSAPGNPAIFGNNIWDVYGYSDNSFTTYAGYYTEPSLSFLSSSRYTTSQSPSYALGYQGCLIPTTNFSVSMRRSNFTPADYQLDLTAVDDIVYILVNGVLVYTHSCCVATSGPINNVWTGYLGSSDQVEIRWIQATSTSQLGVNFTPVTPAPVVPGTIGNNQSVCYGDAPAAGFVNSASPTSGCTLTGYQWQSSVDSITWNNISGATALTYTVSTAMTQTTWYRRVVTDACNNSAATPPVRITVNVIPPGDPTAFGDNVWNADAYQYPSTNMNFSAATYRGYYTEPSLSFNSTSRWPNGGSPSVASGYQGCNVAPTYNWMVYKRTDFSPAIYQIDIPAHDDYCYLYINGNLVFQHISCCDSHTNVWTGPLGASDQVEFRVEQMAGGSYGAITLTPVTPAALVASAITPSQTTCAGNVPPTPMTQSVAPSGGCTIQGYQWQSSTDNGSTWNNISGATASSYTITTSVYVQTLYRQVVNDVCGNSASSLPDTVYMNNTAPGDPTVFGPNIWNVYCFQDVNYSIYAGYYTEPSLTFTTAARYSVNGPPSAASGYQGCQLINTYYSVSMKRTGFTAGTYQIDVTADDDYTSVYINGLLVSSLTYPAIQNNIWTGVLGPADQVEVRWRNNAGPGQTGIRFTSVTPTPLIPGTITAYNPNLCTNDIPQVTNTVSGSGGCYITYYWQSSTDGGTTWATIAGTTGNSDTAYTAGVSPTVPTQYRRVATDVCADTAYSNSVTFTPGAGAVGNPAVFGNGVWNAYCYNANGAPFSAATYLGYYSDPSLSFNSANYWGVNSAPSTAAGYQGCQVDQVNHWVSYRRTNFSSNTYQLDIPTHDDDVYLYINGVLVFSQAGCCSSSVNVWTGTLGPSDQVEYRWRQNYGASQGVLNLTPVSPATSVTPGTIGASQTICSNTVPAAFTSTTAASSTCYFYYQWQSQANCTGGWTNIAGAIGAGYAVSGGQTVQACYRRMATDACGNIAYSNTVTVAIYSAVLTPGAVSASQTICSGATPAAFTSTSLPTGGDGNYVYQWQSSPDSVAWSNVSGATGTSYAPGALTATTFYQRTVTACGATSSAITAGLKITVNQPTVITTQPPNSVACAGNNTSVSVAATGTALTYQWQLFSGSVWNNISNGAIYGGATTATLTMTGVTSGMNGAQYRVIISGGCSSPVTSGVSTLMIGISPSISGQPVTTTTCVGSTTGFTVTASGSGLTYQWQQKIGGGPWTSLADGGVYSGTLTASLTLAGVPASMNNYTYQCVVTSSCGGTITSSTATLLVVAAINNTISANQSLCSGSTAATLTGTASGSYTYTWQSSTVSATAGFVTVGSAANYNPNPVSTTSWYRRMVANTGCSNYSNVISIAYNTTFISISAQPVNQAICAGGTAVYNVTASGPGTLSYQWYQYNGSAWSALSDGGMYSGSATASLTITGAASAMNGYRYYVQVFASGCTSSFLNSSQANLTTNNAPVITYSNPDVTACSGNNVNLSVTATGIGLTYQWQLNTGSGWNNLSNSGNYTNVNSSPLVIVNVNAGMSGYQYQCVVTGTCAPGTATSGTTHLTVNPPLSGNSVSSSQTLCAGTPAPFTVTTPSGGDGAYTYQWYQNTGSGYSTISGATSINYPPGPLSQTTQFIRNVYDGTCAASSSIAITITITPPTSTSDPVNTAVCAATNAGFSVTATGTATGYQWQVNTGSGTFVNISNGSQYTGVTTANLTVIAPAYAMNGYQYRCVVTGNCSPTTVNSNFATLTVNPLATITGQPSNVNSCQGSTVSYSVTATGSGLTYQWQEKVGSGSFTPITNGGIYSGAQTSVLTLTGITTSMNTNQYLCTVTLGSCPANSNPASLTVNQQPALVITNPAAVCSPSTVDITAAAVTAGSTLGGGTLTYWKDAAATVVLTNPSTLSVSNTYYIRVSTSTVCYDIKPVVVVVNAKPSVVITNPAPVCYPGTVDITAAAVTAGSTSGLTYTYFTDAGGTTTLSNPGTISVSNTYYIKGAAATGCNTISPVSVVVNALPAATISYSGSPYCATGIASVTQTGITGGTYASTAGLSLNAATGAINLAASTAGIYTVTYSFSNGTCSNTTTASVTINALPTATIAYGGSPYCATGTASVTQTGTTGGTYASTAGLSLTAGTGAINLATSTPGTYTVTYSFSSGGCSNTATTSVTINALPTATIAYGSSPYCATGTASVTQTGTTGGTYASTAGLSITAGTGAINLTTSTPGTYTITYSFSNGTCSNTATTSVTINALPTATISYSGSPYCATGTASITQTGTTGGTYASTAGLSITAGTGAINLATSTPGTYTVTYSFNSGGCSNTATTSVTINALPTATIAYGGSPYCATGTASVTQTGTTGGTYASTAGLSITAGTGAINLTTSTPGTYTITYSFSNGTCSNTATTSVTINALPTATIAYGGSPYCATGTAFVTQTGTTGGTYASTAGLSITAGTGAINLATSTPGTYTVTYSFSSGGCSNTATTSVTINALPTATIAYGGSPYCATGTGTVTQTGTAGGTYASIAGLSLNAGTGAINLLTSTPGTYTVTYSFSSGGCSNTATTSVTINALPTATIAYGGSPYCATGSASVTQTGTTGGTYASTAGLSITTGTGAINLATSTAGTYTVTYSFSSGGCSNTATTSVTINALPTATISYSGSPYCATGTASVTQTGTTGGTYASTAGLSITAGTGVINLATSTPGTYTVTYSFSNGTCSNTTTTSVTVKVLPTATIAYGGSPYCATGTASVTQTGTTGGTYASTAGLSITAGTGAINLATSTAGTYTVTYTFSNGTCSNTATTSVTINALPTATISYSGSPYCATGIAPVTQTGITGGTYASTAGLSLNAGTGTINLATSTAGIYTVTYSFGNGTCSNTTTTSVTINALPTAAISYSGSPYCATGTASVTQTGTTGGTYASTAGLSITAGTGTINLATSTPGTYMVTYSFSNGTCNNTTTTTVTINALPTATIAYGGSPYCATGTGTATQTGTTGGTYSAAAGLTINAGTGAIDLVASTPGTYTVTYSFSSGGCSNTTTTSVTINALPAATIVYPGTPYCGTGTAAVTQTGQAGGTYSSTAGLTINAGTGAIDLVASTPGTYTVTYSFSNGTCSNTTTNTITINALATASIAYAGNPYCATGMASVTQTGSAGGTYSSTAGLTINTGTGSVDLVTSTPGTYTVTYSFTNGTCSNTTTTTITVDALPAAAMSYSGSPYCATGTASVTQTGTTGGTYASTAGLSLNAGTGAINLATSTAGTYTVTYSFSNGTCSNTATTSVTINALPTAAISYSGSPYCAIGTATVTQTGTTGGTYASIAGLSLNAGTGAINLATSTAGTYTVTYSFSNGTCSNTTTASVTINALPTSIISYSGSPYCATGTASVTQTGTAGGTYVSTTGLSLNTVTGAINLGTSTPGTYTVTYSFSNGTCNNTTTTTVTINALPTAAIAYGGSPYCATGTGTATQTGTTGGTYSAAAGLTINAGTGAIDLVASTPGTYTVTYSFSNGTCSNTTTTPITINALPSTTIAYSGSPYCATGTATVTQTGQAGGTYSSTAGLTINAGTGAIDLVASTAGTYTVTYSFSNGTCSNTTTTPITINALPTAAINYIGSPYCATGTATVTQTGTTGGTYASTAGLSLNAGTGAINLATSIAGVYTVTYTFSNGTCSNTATTSVTINALPAAAISYSGSPYCATGMATVTQTGTTGGTYASIAGLSLNAGTGAINLLTSTPGTYTVTYSFSSGGCSNTATTSVTINALPTAAISYSGSPYCATGTATVTQTGTTGGTYASTAGLSITAGTGAINLATSTPGTYTVTYSFGNGTCSNTTTTSVTINALPTAAISYSGSPYCATGTASVTQTGTTGGTYASTAGLSITAGTGAINLATSTPGTYTVTYSFSNGTCSNTTATTVTINALPTAAIAYGGNPYCATGRATVTQTGQAGGTYSSTAGLTINAGTGAIDLVSSSPGTYTVIYSYSNGTCSNTATTSITINALPTATIAYSGSPYCATGTASVTQTGTTGGIYASTAGLTINAGTGAIDLVASTAGTYTVTYSFNNGTCSNTTTATITINSLPTATIAYTGMPYCTTGTATVTRTGQAGGTYSSTAGLTINAGTGSIDLVASTAGTYTVTYSFGNGTCTNTTTTSVTINALPTATIVYGGSSYCATGTATVTRTGQAGGMYSSTAGLTINAGTGDIDLVASTTGAYTVTYSFGNGTCVNTTTTSVTINALPTATIAYTGSPYCATGTATVTRTGQAGGTYSSTAGLTINAGTGAIDVLSSAAGSYTVTYSFSNGTCSNTTTTNVTIDALPTATIAYGGTPYCATGTASVTQTGQTGGTYASTTGLSLTAGTGVINLATSTPGIYTVTYSFGNGTCTYTATTSVTINALPAATITYAGSPYCATGIATVIQTGPAGGTYSSTTGLSINAGTGDIDLVMSIPGAYTVSYNFTNGVCSNSTTATITINPLPTAIITYSGSPHCAAGTATVTQTGPAGGSYSSASGLVINTGTGAINLAASTPGTYTVTYGFSNGTCSSTTTTSVVINALPTAMIAYSGTPYCATGTATVTQTGQTGGTYSSTTGLSMNAGTGDINLASSTAGSYTVTYTFSDGTCSNTTTTTIVITALPVAAISYTSSPYCTVGNASVTLTGTAGGTYSSGAGLAINAGTGMIDLAASSPGTYTVMYSFASGACSNSTTTSVVIRNPALVITNPPAACSPATVNLTPSAVTAGSDAGLTYAYYTDAAGTLPVTNPSAVAAGGTYYIKGTNTSTGCTSTIQPVVATINTPPSITVSGNTDVCKGSADTLVANSPGNTIQWLNLGAGASIVVNPMTTDTYYASATNAYGCSDTASMLVAVKPFAVTLSATPDPTLSGKIVTLTTSANFGYQVLAWTPDYLFADQMALSQTVTVRDTTKTFSVIAMSTQGCLDTATLVVDVDANLGDFFIPNAFTPNNDGKNDVFRIYGSSIKELEVRIFNQWGELVFESHDPLRGWDGTLGGKPEPTGPYIYAVKVVFYNNHTYSKKGTVSLIR